MEAPSHLLTFFAKPVLPSRIEPKDYLVIEQTLHYRDEKKDCDIVAGQVPLEDDFKVTVMVEVPESRAWLTVHSVIQYGKRIRNGICTRAYILLLA